MIRMNCLFHSLIAWFFICIYQYIFVSVAYNIDQTFNTSLAADGSLYNLGLTSFLTSDNPMALFNESTEILNSGKCEVITLFIMCKGREN